MPFMTVHTTFRRCVAWLPALGWCGAIFWLSSKSDIPEPGFWLPPFTDKIVHATLYGILASFSYAAARYNGACIGHAVAVSIAIASLYGITDEWHQTFVHGRTPDMFDWLADTIGAALFTVPHLLRRVERESEQSSP